MDWQSVALFIGNVTAASEAGHEVCTQRIAKQILPSGEEWIELERAVPSGYCQYNLEALVQDADLAASLPSMLKYFAFIARDFLFFQQLLRKQIFNNVRTYVCMYVNNGCVIVVTRCIRSGRVGVYDLGRKVADEVN